MDPTTLLSQTSFDTLARAESSIAKGQGRPNVGSERTSKADRISAVKSQLQALKSTSSVASKKNSTGSNNDPVGRIERPRKTSPPPKRMSKSAPAEQSSKKPVSRYREAVEVNIPKARDPRFDPAAGVVNESQLKKNYAFLNEYKEKEIGALKEEVKKARESVKGGAGLDRDVQEMERVLKRMVSGIFKKSPYDLVSLWECNAECGGYPSVAQFGFGDVFHCYFFLLLWICRKGRYSHRCPNLSTVLCSTRANLTITTRIPSSPQLPTSSPITHLTASETNHHHLGITKTKPRCKRSLCGPHRRTQKERARIHQARQNALFPQKMLVPPFHYPASLSPPDKFEPPRWVRLFFSPRSLTKQQLQSHSRTKEDGTYGQILKAGREGARCCISTQEETQGGEREEEYALGATWGRCMIGMLNPMILLYHVYQKDILFLNTFVFLSWDEKGSKESTQLDHFTVMAS